MKTHRIEPGPGQESVWDYPRPPRPEAFSGHIEVVFNGVAIVDTRGAMRVIETSHPPVYYIPPEDIHRQYIIQCPGTSYCEWKGQAYYYSVAVGQRRAERACWYYPDPTPGFSTIKDFVAFYPGLMDACFVNSERVEPQPGGFYGGWVTSTTVGPFKGEPGTEYW
ncbi:hypothetical protein SCALIN_C35_0008 [Candidatus Scalindua japonica]|uniref:DUF427 domain-containing protein n=1 Tax=Candidatus Scalindua japonica TaxID=1284222 RepID=A0A286U361_9BACT|nr:DUF427 domain-containing protein [Candidatus Scalindua japonica]GAX62569.1 hypothetical protein SCALIN_C35_0008 [Candidatus Scalindua japonica]